MVCTFADRERKVDEEAARSGEPSSAAGPERHSTFDPGYGPP